MSVRETRRSAATKSALLQSPTVANQKPSQLSSPPATPGSHTASKKRKTHVNDKTPNASLSKPTLAAPKNARKRQRVSTVKDEDANELPHNLGSIPVLTENEGGRKIKSPLTPKEFRKPSKVSASKQEDVNELAVKAGTTPGDTPKKAKNTSYGLTPGQTPYPNWPHPTADECLEVTRLLSTVHGEIKPPETIPMPSLTVSGCGEVPSVLDALIRTRLSAATSGTNSSRAFAGLVSKFGILQEGIGKGSVDWNKVRLSDTKEIFEAIKSGGLADVKSKDIKKILQMVWEENQERRNALISSAEVLGSVNEDAKERNAEVAKAEQNVLSLDHFHLLSNDEAFNALVKYPGIGPKTASCVLLFCLQRPSFAVDTHVFRLSKWLGWVPAPGDSSGLAPGAKGKFTGPTRNSTYAHLEVRIPDNLKYPLHQLFIKHGKTCPRCRAITGENSERWDDGCVIDHLVKRYGGRKGIGRTPPKRKKKQDRKESGTESSDLSSLASDDDGSDFSAG